MKTPNKTPKSSLAILCLLGFHVPAALASSFTVGQAIDHVLRSQAFASKLSQNEEMSGEPQLLEAAAAVSTFQESQFFTVTVDYAVPVGGNEVERCKLLFAVDTAGMGGTAAGRLSVPSYRGGFCQGTRGTPALARPAAK